MHLCFLANLDLNLYSNISYFLFLLFLSLSFVFPNMSILTLNFLIHLWDFFMLSRLYTNEILSRITFRWWILSWNLLKILLLKYFLQHKRKKGQKKQIRHLCFLANLELNLHSNISLSTSSLVLHLDDEFWVGIYSKFYFWNF